MVSEYDGFYHLTPRGWIVGAQWREGVQLPEAHSGTPDDAVATYRLHVPAGDPDDRTFTETWRRPSAPGHEIDALAARYPHPVGPPDGPPANEASPEKLRPDERSADEPVGNVEPPHDALLSPGDEVTRRDGAPVFPAHGGPG